MEKRSNTGKSLGAVLDSIIREQIKSSLYQNSIDEKERQKQFLGEDDDDLFDDESDDSGESDEDSGDSKTMSDELGKIKSGDITPDDVIEKLNGIRAGHSLKDDKIAAKISEYVESLSKPEKVALMAFLKGISQIVSGEVDAEQALEPGDDPAHVKMQKGVQKQKKSIKPNVIKAPAKDDEESEKKEKKSSKEDTSGPVPITPKKK